MNKFGLFFIISSLIFAHSAHALERTEFSFSPFGRKSADKIVVSFLGKKFDPALDLLKENNAKDIEIKKIQDFFVKLYRSNSTGTKESILSIWAPAERAQVSKTMTQEYLDQNKSRFAAMTSLRLDSVIKYGDYYVCLLQTEFGNQLYPIKFTLKPIGDSLYLTNELNGDDFYDNVIHFLDYRREDSRR